MIALCAHLCHSRTCLICCPGHNLLSGTARHIKARGSSRTGSFVPSIVDAYTRTTQHMMNKWCYNSSEITHRAMAWTSLAPDRKPSNSMVKALLHKRQRSGSQRKYCVVVLNLTTAANEERIDGRRKRKKIKKERKKDDKSRNKEKTIRKEGN